MRGLASISPQRLRSIAWYVMGTDVAQIAYGIKVL